MITPFAFDIIDLKRAEFSFIGTAGGCSVLGCRTSFGRASQTRGTHIMEGGCQNSFSQAGGRQNGDSCT